MSKKIVFVKELTKYLTNFYFSKENLKSSFIKKDGSFSIFERLFQTKTKDFEPVYFLLFLVFYFH